MQILAPAAQQGFIGHVLNEGVTWAVLIPLIIGGMPGTFLGARMAGWVSQSIIRRGIVIVLTLTGIYVVSSIKGQPIPPLWPRFYYALAVNGAWGLGTALFLKLFGEARKDTARA